MMLEIGLCAVVVVSVLWWMGGEDEPSRIEPDRNYTRKERRSRAEVLQHTRKAMEELVKTDEYEKWRSRLMDRDVEEESGRVGRRDAAKLKVIGSVLVVGCYVLYTFPFSEGTLWSTYIGQALLLQMLICCDSPYHASMAAATVTASITLWGAQFTTGYYLYALLLFASACANEFIPVLKETKSLHERVLLYETVDYDTLLEI